MKSFFTISLMLAGFSVFAQKPLTFKEVLKTAEEISITDSLSINYNSFEKKLLDSITGKYFFQIISRTQKQFFQETKYFIVGKITSLKDFNILFFCVEELPNRRIISEFPVIPEHESKTMGMFFLLFDKENNYKNNFLAAMNFEKKDFGKTITRKINSWLYRDLKIIQHSEIESGEKKFDLSMEYRVNDYGVFAAYPKYTKN